jgi:hypothetical protein
MNHFFVLPDGLPFLSSCPAGEHRSDGDKKNPPVCAEGHGNKKTRKFNASSHIPPLARAKFSSHRFLKYYSNSTVLYISFC